MFNLITTQALILLWPTIATAVVGWGVYQVHTKVMPRVDAWLEGKAKSSAHGAVFSTLEKAINALEPIVENATKSTTQTFVDALKESKTWNAQTAEQAMQKSLAATKALAGPQIQAALQSVGVTDVDSALKVLIEAALQKNPTAPAQPA